MKRPSTILISFGFFVFAFCTSSEESGAARQDPITVETVPPPVAETTLQPEQEQPLEPTLQDRQAKTARLKSIQDTVVASVTKRSSSPASVARPIKRPPNPAYTVQVGAFNRAQNALTYEKLAKERFLGNSVHNRYEPMERLYRVSIGKFTTRQEAAALRREIMKKYPKEYAEAWVNYIAQ